MLPSRATNPVAVLEKAVEIVRRTSEHVGGSFLSGIQHAVFHDQHVLEPVCPLEFLLHVTVIIEARIVKLDCDYTEFLALLQHAQHGGP